MRLGSLKLPLLLILLLGQVACTTLRQDGEWPEDMPSALYYAEQYQAGGDELARVQSLDNYYMWIKRFYNGWVMQPQGWHWLTDAVSDAIEEPAQRKRVRNKMGIIGKRISAEWAKDKNHRVINTRHLIVWSNAVRLSVREETEEALADQVLADVDALLERQLAPKAISKARYADLTGFSLAAEDYGPDDDFE